MQRTTATPVIGPLRLGMEQPWYITNDIRQGVMRRSRHRALWLCHAKLLETEPLSADWSVFLCQTWDLIFYSRILKVNWLRNLEWLDATRGEFPSHSLRMALPLPWLDGFQLDALRPLLSNGRFEYRSATF